MLHSRPVRTRDNTLTRADMARLASAAASALAAVSAEEATEDLRMHQRRHFQGLGRRWMAELFQV